MDTFVKFLTEYGIGGLVIIIASFGLTQLVKIPLKKWAEKYATKNGVDKAVVTKWFFAIPLVLAFIGSIINQWAVGGWGDYLLSDSFEWTAVIAETIACAGVTGSAYGIVEGFVKASTSKQLAKITDGNTKVAEARAVIANETLSAADKVNAEKEAEKAQLKLDKLAQKQKAEEAKRVAKVEKLQAKIAKLDQSKATQSTLEPIPTEAAGKDFIN